MLVWKLALVGVCPGRRFHWCNLVRRSFDLSSLRGNRELDRAHDHRLSVLRNPRLEQWNSICLLATALRCNVIYIYSIVQYVYSVREKGGGDEKKRENRRTMKSEEVERQWNVRDERVLFTIFHPVESFILEFVPRFQNFA